MKRSRCMSLISHPEQFVWISKEVTLSLTAIPVPASFKKPFAPLQPIRDWLEAIKIDNPQTAARFCQLIPARCPFERTISLFGRPLLRIPPLCKLNPFYEQLVSLRFRALCYLADECGEDVTRYC